MSLKQLCTDKPNPWATLRCQSLVVDDELVLNSNTSVNASVAVTDSVAAADNTTGELRTSLIENGAIFEFSFANTNINTAAKTIVYTFDNPGVGQFRSSRAITGTLQYDYDGTVGFADVILNRTGIGANGIIISVISPDDAQNNCSSTASATFVVATN